jgi:hypothetical protein
MIGPLMMCVSAVILLAGMLAGIVMGIKVMGIKQDFALAPAHAHLNLIGRRDVVPVRSLLSARSIGGTSTRAGWLHMIGPIVFPMGVAIVILKREALVVVTPIRGLADRGRGHSAVRRGRVPDRARLSIAVTF